MNIKILLSSVNACVCKLLYASQWYLCRCYRHIVESCVIEGRKTLIYETGLQKYNTTIYLRLVRYAKNHGYDLKEDQRCSNERVTYDRRSASVSILILTFSLISKNVVLADSQEQVETRNDSFLYHEVINFNEEIDGLLAWISQKISPYNPDVTVETPRLMNLPRLELYKMAFGKDLPLSIDKLNSKIYGLYNYQDETIYLLDSVDLNTNKGKSILLHELVHYFQYKNGYHNRVVCKNQLEYLAYYLEAQYMQEQGERVAFTQDHLRRVVRCVN